MAVDRVALVRRQTLLRGFAETFPMSMDAMARRDSYRDAARTVADRLAWIHQTACGERELLLLLFDAGAGADADGRT